MDNQENNQTNLNQGGASSTPPVVNPGAGQMPDNHPMGVPVDSPVQAQEGQTISQPPPVDPPTASPSGPPPVTPNQVEQGTSNSMPKSDNKLFIFIIGAGLVLIIFIIIILVTAQGNNQKNQPVPTPQAQAVTPTPEEQGISSDQPITSQADVENALMEVDKTDPDRVGSDLGQNDQDAATF